MALPKSRFLWSELRGRCRRRILVGLVLMLVAAGYGLYAARNFGRRGSDDRAFDQPLVRIAHRLTQLPRSLRTAKPQTYRELYLMTVVTDQQDVMFGLTLLALRMVATLTAGGLGLVFLTAGSTEWEVRSERARGLTGADSVVTP